MAVSFLSFPLLKFSSVPTEILGDRKRKKDFSPLRSISRLPGDHWIGQIPVNIQIVVPIVLTLDSSEYFSIFIVMGIQWKDMYLTDTCSIIVVHHSVKNHQGTVSGSQTNIPTSKRPPRQMRDRLSTPFSILFGVQYPFYFGYQLLFYLEASTHLISVLNSVFFERVLPLYLDTGFWFIWNPVFKLFGYRPPIYLDAVSKNLGTSSDLIWTPVSKLFLKWIHPINYPRLSPTNGVLSNLIIRDYAMGWRPRPNKISQTHLRPFRRPKTLLSHQNAFLLARSFSKLLRYSELLH